MKSKAHRSCWQPVVRAQLITAISLRRNLRRHNSAPPLRIANSFLITEKRGSKCTRQPEALHPSILPRRKHIVRCTGQTSSRPMQYLQTAGHIADASAITIIVCNHAHPMTASNELLRDVIDVILNAAHIRVEHVRHHANAEFAPLDRYRPGRCHVCRCAGTCGGWSSKRERERTDDQVHNKNHKPLIRCHAIDCSHNLIEGWRRLFLERLGGCHSSAS